MHTSRPASSTGQHLQWKEEGEETKLHTTWYVRNQKMPPKRQHYNRYIVLGLARLTGAITAEQRHHETLVPGDRNTWIGVEESVVVGVQPLSLTLERATTIKMVRSTSMYNR